MKQRNKKASLRMKLLILCSIIILCALSLQAVLYQNTSSRLLYDQAKDSNIKSLKNMQEDIFSYITLMKSSMLDIYSQKSFIADLPSLRYNDLQYKYGGFARQYVSNSFETGQRVCALYIYDENHQIISTYRHASTPKYKYPINIYEEETQYNSAKVKAYIESGNTDMLISSYHNTNRETDMLRFVFKIYINNRASQIGYIVCDVDTAVLKEIVEKYTYSEDQVVWFQPNEDRIAYMYGNIDQKQSEYFEEQYTSRTEDRTENSELKSNLDTVLFQVPQNRYQLDAYSIVPETMIQENQKAFTQSLLTIALAIIIIFVLATAILTNSLTRPLQLIVKTMNQIKEGERTLRITNMSNDEFGTLAISFNEMLDEIETLIAKEYESKLLIQNAEYKALQAQINPHFLYNTLDTMSSIAEMQNCHGVSSLCQALSNIFRYSIDMKGSLSTIQKEVTHVKNYLYVMQVRMQNSIQFGYDIPNELMDIAIPKISLQPLLENSIKHGLKNKRGDKIVRLEVSVNGENLELSVIDNGVGLNASDINEKLSNSPMDVLEKSESIGIYNINARVKMLFGKDYGIFVSCNEVGTKVTMRIPKRQEVDDNETYL